MTHKPVPPQTAAPAPAAPVPAWTRLDGWLVGAVVALALAVRAYYYLKVSGELWFTIPVVDSENYHLWAQQILRGDFLGKGPLVHSPLYAFFLAGLYAVLGVKPAAAAAVQLALGGLSCGVLYWLGRRHFSRWVGVLAACGQALYGVALFHEGTLLTVLLIHVLHLGVLVAVYWAAERKSVWAWAVPGVLLGLSVLTRPNVLIWAVALGLWLVLLLRRQPRRLVGSAAVLGASILLLMTPVLARNLIVLHEWIPTVSHGGVNFYLGNSAKSNVYFTPLGNLGLNAANFIENSKKEAEKLSGRPLTYTASSRFWMNRAWREIAADWRHWEGLLIDKFVFFFNYYEYTTSLNYYAVQSITPMLRWPWLSFRVIAPLALLGLFFTRRRWLDLFPFYSLVGAYLLSNTLFFITSEYRYAAMPALFLFAGAGVEGLLDRVRGRRWQQLALPTVFLALLAGLVNADLFGREGRDYNLATGHVSFANILLKLGERSRAADEYDFARSMIKNRPENQSWLSYQEGLLYLEDADYPKALTALREAYGLSEDDEQVSNALATALTATGYYDEAIELRKKVVGINPQAGDYQMNLGITYLWAGQDKPAAQAFTQAVKLDPALAPRIAQARKDILANRAEVRSGAKKILPRMLDVNRRPDDPMDNPANFVPQPSYQPPTLPYQPPSYQPPPVQYQPPTLPYQPPPVQYQPPPNPPPAPPR